MMNFDEFLEATRARVQEELPDTAVKIQEVNKLQGESYVGISVQPEGAAAAATFNIGPAFERYQADPSQESAILDKIAADAIRLPLMRSRCLPPSRSLKSTASQTMKARRTIL